jgi:Ca2+-binding EF-hand superfamily protein
MIARPRLVLAVALCLATSAWAQDPPSGRNGGQGTGQGAGQGGGQGGGGFDYRRTILGAADANGDGAVSADEWRTLTAGLEQGEAIDKARLKARVLATTIDRNGDRQGTASDLDDALKALDADSNGALDATELSARGRRGQGLGVALQAADADANGEVSQAEREAFLREAGADASAPIAEATWVAWIARVQARPSADRTAFTPAVLLLSLDGALDQDSSGTVEPKDLEQLFKALDADANGSVDGTELRPARGGNQGGAPESFRQADDAQRAKPPLIKWQRTLDDALELQKRTGQPLLICVNMDGEPASESLAWFRYRDPEFARLTEGFVCLIVSPDRHTPIDRDDRGRRRPDPRFGRVIESEHEGIEPVLYERYFNGTRVAPRHVGVAPDGSILFDIYLTNDLTQIDKALAEHGKPAPNVEKPAEQVLDDVLGSPDATDRDELEAFAVEGTWREAFQTASGALDSKRTAQQPELLRLALRHEDPRVVRQALWTAVREPGLVPPDLVGEVFRASAPHPLLRGALTGAFGRLQRLAATQEEQRRAQGWYLVFDGLAQPSQIVDVERWRTAFAALQGYAPPTYSTDELDPIVEELSDLQETIARAPKDAALRLRQAEGSMKVARILIASRQDPSIALEEAYAAAQAAESAGEASGRAAGIQCWVAFQQVDLPAAVGHGARALPALARDPDPDLSRDVLHAFAQARMREIFAASAAGESFEPSWVADVRDAYEALLAHPSASDKEAGELIGFLGALNARAEQDDVAVRAVERFPLSAQMHEALRFVLLRDEGAAGLEAHYAALQPPPEARAAFTWFAGLASLLAAERQVGNGANEAALESYARCSERMRASMQAEPSFADSALHYLCLARAGEARVFAEAQRWDDAATALREGLTGRAASAGSADGLGHTPAQTAQLVLSGLSGAGLTEQAKSFREALQGAGVDLTARRTEE